MTRTKNGQYIEVSEVVGIGNAQVYFKISPDGVTWEPSLGTLLPWHHAGPSVTSFSDGTVAVTSCSNEIFYSHDYGRTWRLTRPHPWDIGFHLTWLYDLRDRSGRDGGHEHVPGSEYSVRRPIAHPWMWCSQPTPYQV